MAIKAATHHATPTQVTPPTQEVVPTPVVEQVQEVAKEVVEDKVVATEAFDVNKYLSEKTGGKVTKEEDLMSFINRHDDLDIDNLKEKASKTEEYEARYKEVEPANDFIKELNKLVKGGASQEQVLEFYNLSQTDLSALSPKEAEILRLIKEKGLSKEDATFKVSRLLDEDRLDEETVKLNEIELKTRYKENVEFLKQYRKELTVTEAQKVAEQDRTTKQQYISAVEQAVPSLSKELVSIKFDDISGNKENPMAFEYVLPDDFKKEADKILKNTIISNRLNVSSQDDMVQAKEIALSIAIASDPSRFAKAVTKHYQACMAEIEATKGAKEVRPSQAVIVNQAPATMQRPKVVFRANK